MGAFDIPGTSWVQVGELGLAFIVIILCAGLVTFVMKSSAHREDELLKIIEKVLPMMECLSAGMENMTRAMESVNFRLESIEENQMRSWSHKKPNQLPHKKTGNTVPVIPLETIPVAPMVEPIIEVSNA